MKDYLQDIETRYRAAFESVGDEGIVRLTAAFYRRVPHDDILGPMYPQEDLEGAETRLRDFLRFRWGGRQDYLDSRGHPRLRMRHVPFAIDRTARDRWISLMDSALDDVEFPPETSALFRGFFRATADFLVNRPFPTAVRP